MKTIVIWDDLEANLIFFVLDGDYRKFDNIYINRVADNDDEEMLQSDLVTLVYDETGSIQLDTMNEFPTWLLENFPGEYCVITAGVLP